MRITEVVVGVADLADAVRCWSEVLRLPVEQEEHAAVVRVGATTLRLEPRPDAPSCEHLAISIGPGALPAAKAWLLERTGLLEQDGRDEFEGPPSWDSRSVYFDGPSRAVLELIERRRLPLPRHEGAFTAQDLLRISEVGVAVDDVPEAVRRLGEIGVHPFAGSSAPDFAAVGDEDGLLILAATGRMWLPTDDRPATPAETRVAATTDRAARLEVGGAQLRLVG